MIDYVGSILTINDSVEKVDEFVRKKYEDGWVLNWEVSSATGETRNFTDEDGISYTIEYGRNEHNALVPVYINKIDFPKNLYNKAENMPKKKKFKLPVTWEACGIVEIEAYDIEDAIRIFDSNPDVIPLPKESEYVDASFDLSCREISYIELFQK